MVKNTCWSCGRPEFAFLLNNTVEWEFGNESLASQLHALCTELLQRKQLFLVSFQQRTDLALLSKVRESQLDTECRDKHLAVFGEHDQKFRLL